MIIHLTQYIPVKEFAKGQKLKPRTIYDQIRRKQLSYITVCGNKMICENRLATPVGQPHVSISNLEWVHRFAKKHKYSPDTIYQQIIFDKINAVVIGNMVMINPEEETVVSFLKNNPPLKRQKRYLRSH